MTTQSGNSLIDSFINQRVMIVTGLKQTYTDEHGEAAESVRVINGELIGIEDPFLYVGDKGVVIMAINIDDVKFIELEPAASDEHSDFMNISNGDETLN